MDGAINCFLFCEQLYINSLVFSSVKNRFNFQNILLNCCQFPFWKQLFPLHYLSGKSLNTRKALLDLREHEQKEKFQKEIAKERILLISILVSFISVAMICC